MHRNPLRNIFFLILSVMFLNPAASQEQDRQSVTESLSLYFDNIYGDDQRLVSGRIYTGPARGSIQGHPFYSGDEWKDGIIETADGTFPVMKIKYDININRLILEYISTDNAFRQVALSPGKIVSVKMGGMDFICFPGLDDPTNTRLAEVVSKGRVSYLVIKTKALYIGNMTSSSDYEYRQTIKQYLQYEGELIPFRSKRTLYKLFPDKKKPLRKFIKTNYLNTAGKRTEGRKKLLDYLNALLSADND